MLFLRRMKVSVNLLKTYFYSFNSGCFCKRSCKTNDFNTFNSRDNKGNPNVSTIDWGNIVFLRFKAEQSVSYHSLFFNQGFNVCKTVIFSNISCFYSKEALLSPLMWNRLMWIYRFYQKTLSIRRKLPNDTRSPAMT